MPHGGTDERFVHEPVPPGPEALFTFGRGPVAASRRRPAAELASSLPKLTRRSALLTGMSASAVCLHNQNACTNHTVTHSAGPRHPLPGGAETGAVTSFRPRKSPMASHQRETRTERLRTFDRSRAPVAGRCPCRSSSFPRERGETSRNDARSAQSHPPCGMRPRPRHVAKTTDTRCRFRVGAHLRRHVRPSNRSHDGQSRHDPTPVSPATIARRKSTCASPKTHRPSEPERFLGHLRLDSPAKVGRFVTCPECLPPSTEPVSSVAAACWRRHPLGACQAGA
jgi:hypothetical protein